MRRTRLCSHSFYCLAHSVACGPQIRFNFERRIIRWHCLLVVSFRQSVHVAAPISDLKEVFILIKMNSFKHFSGWTHSALFFFFRFRRLLSSFTCICHHFGYTRCFIWQRRCSKARRTFATVASLRFHFTIGDFSSFTRCFSLSQQSSST